MEKVNDVGLWESVDNAVSDLQTLCDVFRLFFDGIEDLAYRKNELSGYASERLQLFCSWGSMIEDGLKNIETELETSMKT